MRKIVRATTEIGLSNVKKAGSNTTTTLVTTKNATAIEAQAKTLRQQVEAIKITTETQCQDARVLLTRIITAKKKAQAFINPILENAKEGVRLAKEQERQLVQPFQEMENSARFTINQYLTEVMRKEREQREEQERLKREYEEKIARSKRPERIKPVEEIPEDELIVAPKMENTSVPMVPKYEIENEELIPAEWWISVLNRDAIWSAVRTAHKNKETLVIPGVRIWEEASLTIRGGR